MLEPHHFWQEIVPPGTYDCAPQDGFAGFYPATLPDGRQMPLPIRVLPGDGRRAVASLIVNQASFGVLDTLVAALAAQIAPHAPDIVVGVPTLGLHLAAPLARALGHDRLVPLGTSRKFWYEERLSAPISSITTPDQSKRIYLDPRMLPLIEGRRVAIVDDVISSGRSMAAVMALMDAAGVEPVVVGAAMLQGEKWRDPLVRWRDRITAPLASPLLARGADGRWRPA